VIIYTVTGGVDTGNGIRITTATINPYLFSLLKAYGFVVDGKVSKLYGLSLADAIVIYADIIKCCKEYGIEHKVVRMELHHNKDFKKGEAA